MLESCRNAHERWGGVNQLIDRWLKARYELIQSYQVLTGAVVEHEQVQSFCQALVDYMSAGHFEVYEQLLSQAQQFDDQKGLELARRIYPRLESITTIALAFNDRCDKGDHREDSGFALELRKLGTLLQERFELEDCLIEVLHDNHAAAAREPV